MTIRSRAVVVVVLAALSVSCATSMGLTGRQLRKARIEVWRDKDDHCQTKTTPFFKARRSGNGTWEIRDDSRCLDSDAAYVEISFDDKKETNPLQVSCSRRGKRKIECRVRGDADLRIYKYSVLIHPATGPDGKEDPEIQIEM